MKKKIEEVLTMPSLLLPHEVAQIFDIDKQTLKRWRKKGKLHPINLSLRSGDFLPQYRFTRQDVIRVLSQEVVL